MSGEERVALVSEWAEGQDLLTGDDVAAALGEPTVEVVDAQSPDVASDEFLTRGPAVAEAFATLEEAERRRNGPGERYDPAPVGVDAFAYETDGGSGALDRLVVVDLGDALIVVVANPASPDAPAPHLTDLENLTRSQVDDLVVAAVEQLG